MFRENNSTILEGFIVDISERKASELELLKAKQKAEESDHLKSSFLANMSHEIRTPMNSIMGFLNLLQEPELSGENKDSYINIVKQSSTRLLNTINDIIEIAKIESGHVKTSPEAMEISAVLEYFYNFFKPEADKKGLSLRLKNNIDKSTDVLRTDRNKLESILNNFMDNALKFTSEGFVEIGADRENDRIVFHVSDSGPGIPADRQEAIFDRFIQADMGINRSHEGSGLGLSISRAYAGMLGGEILVRSQPGEGSTFYLTLPAGTAAARVKECAEKAPLAKRPGKRKTRVSW
ncbi:MAG: ATP-binding protein [Candidatus Marinimicrobia bacterium]|nr:ATP-binding protein [Candidatus Neomarinimicrobiota bacterium]